MSLEYQATFAGIPFITDIARKVRLSQPVAEIEDPNQLPPRTQQVEVDLLDELNRRLPFMYLQDFAPPHNYPNRKTNALATIWPVGDQPAPTIRIGDYFYPTGASRWSVFRGLATSSMAKAMLDATLGGTKAEFVLKANPIAPINPQNVEANYTITTDLYLMPPRPLAEYGKDYDGLYLITLVDERWFWQDTTTTLHVTASTTWEDMITTLAVDLGIVVSYSAIPAAYSQPEQDTQFWSTFENAATLLDAVAYNLGRVVVRDLDGTYNLYTPHESNSLVLTNQGNADTVNRIGGGNLFTSGTKLPIGNLNAARNFPLPTSVHVTFPKYILADPVPHFLNPRYANPRPSAWVEDSYGDLHMIPVPLQSGGLQLTSGQGGYNLAVSGVGGSGLIGTSGNVETIHTAAKALYSGEANAVSGNSSLNQSGLLALAMQIAGDYYKAQAATALDESYPGILNWTPEGLHDVVWTYSAKQRQASCRVMRSEWNQNIREMQHAAPALSGMQVNPIGVGGPSVAQTWQDGSVFLSGQIAGQLLVLLSSGAGAFFLKNTANFPTDQRWVAQIHTEQLLMEGTSGAVPGEAISIIRRGWNGTRQIAHAANSVVTMVAPSTIYGTNLITTDPMGFIYPGIVSSGGITETKIVPQTQTVYALDAVGKTYLGVTFFSGQVNYRHPVAWFASGPLCWIIERNGGGVQANTYYDGQFVGYATSGPCAPVYAVDNPSVTGTFNDATFTGTTTINDTLVVNASTTLNNGETVIGTLAVSGTITINGIVLSTSDCCVCSSGYASGSLQCVSGFPTGPVLSGVWIMVSGYPTPVQSGDYAMVSGYPYVISHASGGMYISISGNPFPVISGSWVSLSGYPYVLTSGSYNLVSGYPYALPSGVWNTTSGYPFPIQSGVWNTTSGYPFPIQSGVWLVVSGYPFPFQSGIYNLTSGYPFPLLSGNYTFVSGSPVPFGSGYILLSYGGVLSGMLASGSVVSGTVASGTLAWFNFGSGSVLSGAIASGVILPPVITTSFAGLTSSGYTNIFSATGNNGLLGVVTVRNTSGTFSMDTAVNLIDLEGVRSSGVNVIAAASITAYSLETLAGTLTAPVKTIFIDLRDNSAGNATGYKVWKSLTGGN